MSSVSGRLQAAMPSASSTMEPIDTTIVRMTRTACNRRELVYRHLLRCRGVASGRSIGRPLRRSWDVSTLSDADARFRCVQFWAAPDLAVLVYGVSSVSGLADCSVSRSTRISYEPLHFDRPDHTKEFC